MFRKQILAQLRRDNPGVPERVLGLLADKIAAKVTAEDQIEGAISELVDSMPISIKEFSDFVQQEGDRRVTEATKKPKTKKVEDTESGDDNEPTSELGELKQLITGLATTVGVLVKEKTTGTIKSKMEAQLTEKKIPLFLLKGRIPETEDEIDDVLADIEADWGTQVQQTSTKKLGSFKAPAGGVKVGEDDDEPVDPSIAEYNKRKLESQTSQATK